MSTTTASDELARPLPYPEDDKLGPLGTRPSVLHDAGELRTKLLEEFTTAVASAREAAGSVDDGPATAVHDSRKALRRARAVLAMLAHALPKSERKAVQDALQGARRSLSTVRDHAVAPETLSQATLDEDNRGTARRVVDNAAEAIPSAAEVKQLLGEAAARAAAQAEALATALPPEVSFEQVVDGIADVYGDARKARRSAKSSKQWFHTWRRRSKELVYMLDFVATHAGPRAMAIRAELDAITDQLGPVVDLVMVREFVATHAQGVPGDGIDRLRDSLEQQIDELMKMTRKGARDAFKQKPKKFGRRLAKSVKRDLMPADDSIRGSIDDDLD